MKVKIVTNAKPITKYTNRKIVKKIVKKETNMKERIRQLEKQMINYINYVKI